MQGEMKRIESGVKMEPLDETRMSIEPPRLHEQQNPDAWKKCVDNASAQLEHQHHRCDLIGVQLTQATSARHELVLNSHFNLCRVQNFQLAVKFGPAVWKAHNARTDVYINMAEKRLREVKAEITKVNQRRKLQQEQAKVTLDRLSKEYNDLVQRNIAIALACKKLEMQKEKEQQDAEAEPTLVAAEDSAMEH